MGWACRLNPRSDCDPLYRKKKEYEPMDEKLIKALKRWCRAGLAIIISGILIHATKDPKWIILAPIIQALAKYLRDKFGIKYMPL